jgi:hypothetical protein
MESMVSPSTWVKLCPREHEKAALAWTCLPGLLFTVAYANTPHPFGKLRLFR